jgi:hypothetical protein
MSRMKQVKEVQQVGIVPREWLVRPVETRKTGQRDGWPVNTPENSPTQWSSLSLSSGLSDFSGFPLDALLARVSAAAAGGAPCWMSSFTLR